MKTFIYAISESKISRTYGGANETAKIYYVKNNRPIPLGTVKWCTRGTYGEETEVQHALANMGHLPKKYAGEYYDRHNGKFQIIKVG